MSGGGATAGFMAMKGGGYYSRATIGAKHVIDRAAQLVLDAVARMDPADDGRDFTMADMGCADGGTSIDMVRDVLAEIRRRCPSRPLRMVYTDLPRNDFGQIFRNVQGLTPEVAGYLDHIPDLYVYASGTSFYQPLFPEGSLHLGFSATASHYVSTTPGAISDHVHMTGASGAERQAFQDQGRRDWESMLLRRARELAPGGRLCLFNFGIDEAGRYLGDTGGVSMFGTFNRLWRALVADGTITAAEYRATNFPQHYRTVAEFTAPLRDRDNPVYRAGLRLEHVETRVVACPFATAFALHGDAARFADEYIPTLRSWSEASFAAGLSPARSAEQRAAIIDRFYRSYRDLVAAAPEGHAMDYVHCYLVLAKP